MASPSSPSPSWVILSALPRLGMLDNNADVSLAPIDAPPRVTLLTLAPRVFPKMNPLARLKLPYLHAADPSGLLLAVSAPPPSPPSSSTDSASSDGDGVDTDLPRPEYLVLDVRASTATTVGPDPQGAGYDWAYPLGVIAAPAGAPGFMLAVFGQLPGCTVLICFSSETGEWVHKNVDNPLPGRIWSFDEVISHDAKLWWVDAAECLLACNPFADQPEMVYVPLPEKEDDDDESDDRAYGYYSTERKLGSRRCVQVSNGKLRCVDVTRARQDQGRAPTVTMRTLADPETAEWTLEYEVRLDEVWGLPEKAPALGLIHPENPDVLYFFGKEYLFGIDMRAWKVVECQAHEPSKRPVSPSSVLSFVLPPALTAGLPVEVSDDNDVKDDDESGAPPSDRQGV